MSRKKKMVCKLHIEFKNGKSQTVSADFKEGIDSVTRFNRQNIGLKCGVSFKDLEGSEIVINMEEVQFMRITKLE